MNRREFLAAGFKLGAAGLLLPAIEPIKRYWALDRTMLPCTTGPACFPGRVVIGDYAPVWIDTYAPSFTMSDVAFVYRSLDGTEKRISAGLGEDGWYRVTMDEPGVMVGIEYLKKPTIRYAAVSSAN